MSPKYPEQLFPCLPDNRESISSFFFLFSMRLLPSGETAKHEGAEIVLGGSERGGYSKKSLREQVCLV